MKHVLVVSLIAVNLAQTWILIGLIGSRPHGVVLLVMAVCYILSIWAMFAALQKYWGFPGTRA